MSKFVCYCSLGVMAQCVADNLVEQQSCHFSGQSANANKCMHLNESMNNHCWNPKAHEYSNNHGVVRLEDVEIDDELETLYDESLEQEMGDGSRRNCKDCLVYTSCPGLVDLAIAASPTGGITDQDLWDTASACSAYVGEPQILTNGGM